MVTRMHSRTSIIIIENAFHPLESESLIQVCQAEIEGHIILYIL